MMLSITTVTRCSSSYKDCSASLHAAKVAGQHERNSAPVAATHCAGNAELSDTTAADHSHPEEKQRPRRRRRRSVAPEGFHTVAALAASGDPCKSTLYRAIENGQLPAHKWRGRLVVADRDYKELFVAVKPLQRAGADNADARVRHD
jgi:hypothetical protein